MNSCTMAFNREEAMTAFMGLMLAAAQYAVESPEFEKFRLMAGRFEVVCDYLESGADTTGPIRS